MKTERTCTKLPANLLRHVLKNDKCKVKQLLKRDSDWNPKVLGRILWHAVRLGALEVAPILVEAGADINMKSPFDASGFSFLHEFVIPKHTSIYKKIDPRYGQLALLMINCGADVNACDKYDESVLRIALDQHMTIDVIEKLFQVGARVKTISKEFFRHPDATKIILKLIMSDSLGMKTRAERAAYVLHCSCLAITYGDHSLACAKIILDMKFAVEDIQKNGSTLCLAIRDSSIDLIRNTLPEVVQCTIERERLELVRLLVEYGFDVNKAAKDGQLPLYVAAAYQQSSITELLIKAGAKVNAFSKGGKEYKGYPLHTACHNESLENIQVLLRYGADINLTDSLGQSPFSLIKYFRELKPAHQIVIEHFAILTIKGKRINDCDLKLIHSIKPMNEYYSQCMKELEMMKTFKVSKDMTFFSIIGEDLTQLLYTTRNDDWRESCDLAQWVEPLYPIFYEKMKLELTNAKRRKVLLRDRQDALYESLKAILPYIPVEKIVLYMYMNDRE